MEENLKEIPITIETAHQFFNKRQMSFIVKMYKDNYKLGFKHGMKIKSIAVLLLFTVLSFGQQSIVTAGNKYETFGETIPTMQSFDTIIEVTLGIPKYEIEQPKVIVKKKLTIFEKIINALKRIFNLK